MLDTRYESYVLFPVFLTSWGLHDPGLANPRRQPAALEHTVLMQTNQPKGLHTGTSFF